MGTVIPATAVFVDESAKIKSRHKPVKPAYSGFLAPLARLNWRPTASRRTRQIRQKYSEKHFGWEPGFRNWENKSGEDSYPLK